MFVKPNWHTQYRMKDRAGRNVRMGLSLSSSTTTVFVSLSIILFKKKKKTKQTQTQNKDHYTPFPGYLAKGFSITFPALAKGAGHWHRVLLSTALSVREGGEESRPPTW